MKRTFPSSILILIFSFAAFAQTNNVSSCPTISVMGPAGIPQPEEPITFTATISEEAKNMI